MNSGREEELRSLARSLVAWLLRSVLKLILVAFVIGGWYLFQNNHEYIGAVIEIIGLAGLDVASWVIGVANNISQQPR